MRAVVLVLLLSSAARADVIVNHYGRLLDGADKPVSQASLTFELFDSKALGQSLWSETYAVQADSNGLYAVSLGDTPGTDKKSLSASVFASGTVWLEISVEGVRLKPRLALSAVPSAVRADHAATAALALDSERLGGVEATEYALKSDLSGLSDYAMAADVYPKTQTYAKDETYSKVELDGLLEEAQEIVDGKLAPLATRSYVDENFVKSSGEPIDVALMPAEVALLGRANGYEGTTGFAGAVSVGPAASEPALQVLGDVSLTGLLRLPELSEVSCTSALEGAIRYSKSEKGLELCNGTSWSLIRAGRDGSSPQLAARSCLDLLRSGLSSGSRAYWIDPDLGSPDNALEVYCDMENDGGGWTLVAKSNGADKAHWNGRNKIENLKNLQTNVSGYVGDEFRLGLGKCYRVTSTTDNLTKYLLVDHSRAFTQTSIVPGGGNVQPNTFWSDTYSTSAQGYTQVAVDDNSDAGTANTRGPGYQGGNWGHTGQNGTRIFGTATTYGKLGYMLVKDCLE